MLTQENLAMDDLHPLPYTATDSNPRAQVSDVISNTVSAFDRVLTNAGTNSMGSDPAPTSVIDEKDGSIPRANPKFKPNPDFDHALLWQEIRRWLICSFNMEPPPIRVPL